MNDLKYEGDCRKVVGLHVDTRLCIVCLRWLYANNDTVSWKLVQIHGSAFIEYCVATDRGLDLRLQLSQNYPGENVPASLKMYT